jgi:hypothetical protein
MEMANTIERCNKTIAQTKVRMQRKRDELTDCAALKPFDEKVQRLNTCLSDAKKPRGRMAKPKSKKRANNFNTPAPRKRPRPSYAQEMEPSASDDDSGGEEEFTDLLDQLPAVPTRALDQRLEALSA